MTVITRLIIACALVCVAGGSATTPENTGRIDPSIATFIEPKDIKWAQTLNPYVARLIQGRHHE